ncbi:CDP-diglyceride synthase [Acetoanaerobium sticklandii]|uniref:Phosphatidate cytidylyltransferase n=1 Tax=Acetoanaerobium sticklandii (strain ATCC 12662 / DSM 519 / JCM 1433 / CCUG 9281 / NCIMB 10654 / HF) TaxID=499177 RepID=E3PSG5_ACESD|nr:phosphatidate cytidylyltransferase [Acetoanaerobium sticklandii]CBH21819.1 CDP-diglyceride synthase [Acetoanaerobium sticklandii]
MKVRIISALVLLPIFFFVIIYGGLVTKLAVLLVALISIKEFTNAFAESGIKPTNAILYIITILFLVPSWLNIWSVLPVLLFILVVGESILLIFGKKTVEDISVSILTFVYITVALSSVIVVREASFDFIWYIFIFAWATDTCAYFAGFAFGKHKLMPKVSPKKTIEGAIGGIIGCIIISTVYAYFVHPEYILLIGVSALIGSVISQAGDLFASSFKRKLGVKDYGNLIPGHGGMLDRIDSIIFTAPFTYIVMFIAKLI